MGDAKAEGLEARIAVRDQLLDGIVKHLRAREPHLAGLVERIVAVIRANDHRIAEGGVSADVEAFAEMDLSRGKAPKPNAFLRAAKLDVFMTTGCLRAALDVYPGGPTEAEWKEIVQEAWRECFARAEALDAKSVDRVLRMRTVEGKAVRLVFLATRRNRRSQERFEDFRKQVTRQNPRPHPWIVRDSKP